MLPLTGMLVANLLDKAVAHVAREEFQRVTAHLTEDEKTRRIESAAASLDLLRKGGTPDYEDPLVAVLYLVQYQLQHINLTYSLIDATARWLGRNGVLTDTGRLHVVDYGCGALAMRFGVILAVSDALESAHNISSVKIDSLDLAAPVVALGVRIWNCFWESVHASNDNGLRWLRQAFGTMVRPNPDVFFNVPLQKIIAMPDADRWLSAIHVVYGGPQGNSKEVQENLDFLHQSIQPVAGFLTAHSSKLGTVKDVCPFGPNYSRWVDQPNPKFGNSIPAPQCTMISRQFRPHNWSTFWEWAPGTVCLAFGEQRN